MQYMQVNGTAWTSLQTRELAAWINGKTRHKIVVFSRIFRLTLLLVKGVLLCSCQRREAKWTQKSVATWRVAQKAGFHLNIPSWKNTSSIYSKEEQPQNVTKAAVTHTASKINKHVKNWTELVSYKILQNEINEMVTLHFYALHKHSPAPLPKGNN